MGDGSIVQAIKNRKEPAEISVVETYREEEELFPAFDWRDEFNNIHKEKSEFENYFFDRGTFLKKKSCSREEEEFMSQYDNLNDFIYKVTGKLVTGGP